MSFTAPGRNSYPVGSQITVRCCFTSRALTAAEQDTFLTDGTLPGGVGVDQTTVFLNTVIDTGSATTQSGEQITHEATGVYSATVAVTQAGTYRNWGYSENGNGQTVAVTDQDVFDGYELPV